MVPGIMSKFKMFTGRRGFSLRVHWLESLHLQVLVSLSLTNRKGGPIITQSWNNGLGQPFLMPMTPAKRAHRYLNKTRIRIE
jgi:hypothetical protein